MTEQTSALYEFLRGRGFVPVGKESYPEFQNGRHDSVLLDLSATLINTWGFALNSVYKNIHGYLCVAWFCDGSPFHKGVPVYFTVLRPSGNPACPLKEIIDILYGLAREAGLPFLPIESVEENFLADYRGIDGYEIKTEYTDDHSEYVYRTEDLIELSGGINLNKRNRVKKFSAKPNVQLKPITHENIGLCLEIQQQWCLHRDCVFCASFAGCEKKSLEIMTGIFDDRIYDGIYGYIDGNPAGYAVWEKKNETLSYLYFGKAIIQDFFAFLIYTAVKDHLSGVTYFNIGEDMGNPGLRTFKKHMGVHELWKKYLCTYVKKGN